MYCVHTRGTYIPVDVHAFGWAGGRTDKTRALHYQMKDKAFSSMHASIVGRVKLSGCCTLNLGCVATPTKYQCLQH